VAASNGSVDPGRDIGRADDVCAHRRHEGVELPRRGSILVGIRFQAGLPAFLQEIFRRLTKVPATARPVGVTSDSSPRALRESPGAGSVCGYCRSVPAAARGAGAA